MEGVCVGSVFRCFTLWYQSAEAFALLCPLAVHRLFWDGGFVLFAPAHAPLHSLAGPVLQ